MSRNHKFDIELPLFTNRPVGDEVFKLEKDGTPLLGVTDLTLRAGANGFTNLVLNFEAGAAVKCTAEMVAHVDMADSERHTLELAEVYRDVKGEVEAIVEMEGNTIDNTVEAQAHFVKRIIEMALERIG